MIRLDSAHPPLWREDGRVQFGAPAVALAPIAAPWVDVVVASLVGGTSRAEVRALARLHGAGEGDIEAFLTAVVPALARRHRHAPIAVQTADDLPARVVRAVLAAFAARTPVRHWAGDATEAVPVATRVVVLAAHRVDPRRVSGLMRDDITHVPLVLDGASATIGPVVVPGRTACLACLDAVHRGDDPEWTTVVSQLLARPRPAVDVALAAEAGRAARFLVSAPIGESTRSLRLRADSFRRAWALHRPSEDCRCRSLGGNETEHAPSDLVLSPSSPRGSGPPA